MDTRYPFAFLSDSDLIWRDRRFYPTRGPPSHIGHDPYRKEAGWLQTLDQSAGRLYHPLADDRCLFELLFHGTLT
jgi:hypothetical protein